jgi:hypothetical protein
MEWFFLKILFDITYKGDLFSLILSLKLDHIYDVEIIFISISKYVVLIKKYLS